MFWQEDRQDVHQDIADDVVDVAFQIACRTLPVDHAWALSEAVCAHLPWFAAEPGCGLHTIHVAESGNGWMRPEGADELLYLSRRTRLVLRVASARVNDVQALVGARLSVAGHALNVEKATVRTLGPINAVFARYVVGANEQDENAFLQAAAGELRAMGVQPRKMLCGIEKSLGTPNGPIRTRSLMIADLTPPESVIVQQRGMGPLRHVGCGLFLPHKDIKELHPTAEN
jgi:CRISPR-associated protein Cas6